MVVDGTTADANPIAIFPAILPLVGLMVLQWTITINELLSGSISEADVLKVWLAL